MDSMIEVHYDYEESRTINHRKIIKKSVFILAS